MDRSKQSDYSDRIKQSVYLGIFYNYKGFHGSINVCREDGIYWAKLLHVPDLVLCEAKTLPGLEHEFKQAVDEYIEDGH